MLTHRVKFNNINILQQHLIMYPNLYNYTGQSYRYNQHLAMYLQGSGIHIRTHVVHCDIFVHSQIKSQLEISFFEELWSTVKPL